MHHLSGHGLACPDVQRRTNGAMLFDYQGKSGCIGSCLPGAVIEQLNLPQLRSAGEALARLHAAGRDFRPNRPNPTGSAWLIHTAEQVTGRLKDRYGEAALTLLSEEMAWQQQHPADNLPQGVIHGDYFCDNILFEGNRLSGVIDFYYAHTAPWIMDIAISTNALAITLGIDDSKRMEALLAGYQQVRPLSDREQSALPALLRLAALRFWLSRLFDAFFPRGGAITQVKDPEEYRRKLLWHRHSEADGIAHA